MKILHVLDHSLPYLSAYSFRSSRIISKQRQLGINQIVLTSPRHEAFGEECEIYDGVEHHRLSWPLFHFLPHPRKVPGLRNRAFASALISKIMSLAETTKIDLIHAHSPALNGLAASRAAKSLGIPCLYELRYYDHDTLVENGQMRYGSFSYHRAQRLENLAIKRADAVVTNSSPLRAELISRGISPHKLFEALNGVDTQAFQPQSPDTDLIERYGLWGKAVIGFIGSFYEYEGLNQLIAATLSLLRSRHDVKLLLVGSGEAEANLRARIPREWRGHFIFAGQIEQEDVPRYYSVMDLVVYPRKSTRLTELTPSTRPLEAMAMERTVIASSIGGMCEIVHHGQTGFLVEPEDTNSLAALIARLAGNRTERSAIGRNARDYVVEHRDWSCIAAKYLELYQNLLKQKFPKVQQMPERESQGWSNKQASERQIKVKFK